MSGRGHHGAGRAIPVGAIPAQGVRGGGGESFRGAENRTSERMVRPEGGASQIRGERRVVVVIHLDLLQNDTAFALDFTRRQEWIGEHVADRVQHDGRGVVRRGGIEKRVVLGGVGVQGAAAAFDRLRDRARGAAFAGTLEEQVLQEVTPSGGGRWFMTAADTCVESDGETFNARHFGRDNDAPAVEGC